MSGAGTLGLTVQALQARLQSIYRVEAPEVERYLVGRETAAAAGHEPRAAEELLVLDEPDGLSLGLYLEESVGDGAARGELGPMAQAAEGVSHFVYLSTRAARGWPVSLLELEVQAEVDKFALLLLPLPGRPGERRRLSRDLRQGLYERVRYLDHLDRDELDRYREANRLGAGYARWLEGRFVEEADVEGLLRELRQSYRLGAGEKLGYLSSRGWASAIHH